MTGLLGLVGGFGAFRLFRFGVCAGFRVPSCVLLVNVVGFGFIWCVGVVGGFLGFLGCCGLL